MTVDEILTALLPHDCTTCLYMQPKKEPPKQGQRFCTYQGPIDTYNNQCLMWKLQPDPKERYNGSWVSE